MKIAALILGLLGALVVGMVGVVWTEAHDHLGDIQQMEQTMKGLSAASGQKDSEFNQMIVTARKKAAAAYPMVGLSLVAFVASVLVFKLPKVSAALLLLAGLIPAVMYPLTLIFGFLLLLAALFAFLAKSKPVAAVA